MNKLGLWIAPLLALTTACSQEHEEKAPEQLTFHEIMKNEVDKNADELWDISNKAIGERAGIDPDKMSDAQWNQLADKAAAVQQAALKIASLDPLVVAKPGVKISDEDIPGGHTAAQVQGRFDKDPEHLRDMARGLAAHTGDLATAARAHDAARAGALIDQLDPVCEGCDLDYWYPDQKALVEEILREQS
jgi:hypothetical protein